MPRCPKCDKLLAIYCIRVEANGRYVYKPIPHEGCEGGEIR